MIVTRLISEMQNQIDYLRRQNKKIGFVPTMGYLHKGHLSLIDIAHKNSDIVVVSIFVNPAQFGPNEDFNKYPRDFEKDKKLCEDNNVDILFSPDVSDMYPQNYSTYVNVKALTDNLCGKSRPEHFQGVTTVCSKLFNIIKPDVAVFGQKDIQQAIVIKRMVRDLNFGIEIIVAPTVREYDGLAMSSRNVYLNDEERKQATILYKSIEYAKDLILNKKVFESQIVIDKIKKFIFENSNLSNIDYIEIVDMENLKPVEIIRDEIILALAIYIGKTRLIDNTIISIQ